MTYLLDTHVFLWLLRTPEKMPAKVRGISLDHGAVLLLSIVTPWEMAIKAGIGKLHAADILNDFDGFVGRGNYFLLQTTTQQVIRGGRLPVYHRDPFDRLLAAQALDLGVPIVSNDAVFDLYGVRRIWA